MKYDIVLWGGSGFSGKLISRYLSKQNVKWAIGGRNKDKLEKVASELDGASAPDILLGDIADKASIDRIVQQGSVIIGAAGPFSVVGTPIVASCVENKRHYVDIDGETPWVRDIIDQYHETAHAAGITLVPNCGFDCVPFDMGAFCTAHFAAQDGDPVVRVRSYVDMRGDLSGGTLNTGITLESMGFGVMKKMANPYLLGGAPSVANPLDKDVKEASFSDEHNTWTGPFMMSPINTRVVRRSIELLRQQLGDKSPYAVDAGYTEKAVAASEAAAKQMCVKIPLEKRKELVESGKLPKPGEGPSEEAMEKSSFVIDFYAETASGKTLHTTMSGRDPYLETATMVSEAALQMLGGERLSSGVVTSAVGLGLPYMKRLNKAGIKFKVHGA
eukprot:TRINITY_DN4837_c0_g2_i1.p1 TRINITY_DN4837_c0_g2~~TRINITY_DN4837_c0_g2_i1.p1  ORF type:complete len:387 (+),score=118.45 TRINITY_DN4837_c0_g2_i1:1424-2584(+)